MIALTEQPICAADVLQTVSHPNAGANLLFLGTTREWTNQVQTAVLNYECYREMALQELQRLAQEAQQRWPLLGVHIVHRLGPVPVGEASLAVAVSSPHRAASFQAGEWLIETLKQVVPIWKQEVDAQGQTGWVHPPQKRTSP